MNFIDILIIVFVCFTCYQGYRRGFIKTLFDTIGLIIAFFISKQFYYIVEEFLLTKTKMYDTVHIFFEKKATVFTEILHDGTKDIANSFNKSFDLPVELQNVISEMFTSNSPVNGDSFTIFVDNITSILIRSLSFIITFLIIYIILVLFSNLINTIFKLPVLNLTNRLFGAATGLLKSVIILYIVFALCSPLIGFIPENKLTDSVTQSESSKIFYKNNIILNYLSYKEFYEN